LTGEIEKIPEEMSDAYFNSRPYSSKIGAWASNQSEEIHSRQELEQRVIDFAKKFPAEVPRPPHWGGYILKPSKIEFWQGRPSRLHDRILYKIENNIWKISRLNP
jgi:pyridoxamine 5'-phosphate oxidase